MDINRKTAYLVLVDVESKKAYSNLALNHQMVINKPNAPGFVRELVYGVLENKLTLDYYIDLLVKDGVKSLKTPELIILRMGVYQIAHMGSVPEYAAVNESVVLAEEILPQQSFSGQRRSQRIHQQKDPAQTSGKRRG